MGLSKGTKIGLIIGTVVAVIALLFLCSGIMSGKVAPAPMSTSQVEDREDCDDEDRREKDVEECGLGVLLDPGKKSAATPVRTPTTRCTKVPARKCR